MVTIIEKAATNSGPDILLRLAGADAPPHTCTLLGLAQGKMHVRSTEWFEPASQVTARFAHLTFSGEVLYCTQKDNWFRVCIDLLSGEDQRRREPRLEVNQPGTVIALSDHGCQSSTQGTLLDLAVSGMRLEIPHQVDPGTMIYIETASALVAGEVRRCHKRSDGKFEAGIQITDVLPDNSSSRRSPGLVKNIRNKLGAIISGQSPPGAK